MPKSKEFVSSSGSESDNESEPKQKKKRPAEKEKTTKKEDTKSSKSSKAGTSSRHDDDDDEIMIEIGKMRYATVSEFRGRKMVNIREYYHDTEGELKPGRKGIALSEDQWKKLKENIDKIDRALK